MQSSIIEKKDKTAKTPNNAKDKTVKTPRKEELETIIKTFNDENKQVNKKTNKVLKLNSSKLGPLENYLKKNSINTEMKLYSFNNLYYITIQPILEILELDIDIVSKQIKGLFLNMKGGAIIVNKYGLIKIINLSNSTKKNIIQDYLCKIFYDSSEKQKELLNNEIKSYQEIDEINKKNIYELSENLNIIKNEYASLSIEFQSLKDKFSVAESEIEQLTEERDHLKKISSSLAKYVRSKKPDVTEAYDDAIEIDEDLDDENSDKEEEKQILKNAKRAKKELKKKPFLKTTKAKTPRHIGHLIKLLRGAYCDDSNKYLWELSDGEFTDDFKMSCSEYKSDGEFYISDIYGNMEKSEPPSMIWYADIYLSSEKIRAVNLFLDLIESCATEETMNKLMRW